MKTCSKCGEAKALDAFYTDRSHRDGMNSRCKACVNEDRRVYRSTRRAQLAANARADRKRTPERGCWHAMLARCYDPKNNAFKNYGGRGIAVHGPWRESFEAFAADVGPRPAGHTLDRIDVNGDYEPGNVRWATPLAQARNMRRNRILVIGGVSRCVSEWAEVTGHGPKLISDRLKLGWDAERAVFEPVGQTRNTRPRRAA